MEFKDYKNFTTESVIYGIYNTITNKWYIGSCLNFKLRIRRHYYYLRKNKHHSQKLQNSWNRYPENVFDIQILYINKYLTNKDLLLLEKEYISKYKGYTDGYNMTLETTFLQSFNLKDHQINKRKSHCVKPVVAINRFTNELIGKYESVSDAAKAFNDQSTNISSCCKHKLNYVKNAVFVYEYEYDKNKNYCIDGHGKGKAKSQEQILKMRQNCKRNKVLYKYDLQYNLIEVYPSRAEAERRNGFKREGLRYKLNKNIDGFIYSEVKNEKDIV